MRLATWNINGIRARQDYLLRWLDVRQPDLVGLQEIGDKAMADELGRLTGMTALFGRSKGSDDSYGDAILSKHPITNAGAVALPTASSSRYQAHAVDVDLSALYGPGVVVRLLQRRRCRAAS